MAKCVVLFEEFNEKTQKWETIARGVGDDLNSANANVVRQAFRSSLPEGRIDMKPENDELTPGVILSAVVSVILMAVLFFIAWSLGVGMAK